MKQEQFNKRWTPEPYSGCWLWTGWINSSGYGQISTAKRGYKPLAHRFSWELYRGTIPEGSQVLHRCDVRSCINPNHLWLGTNTDNQRDKLLKRRQHRYLTPEQVQQIKSSNASTVELGRKFGVYPSTIGDIKRGVTWKPISLNPKMKGKPKMNTKNPPKAKRAKSETTEVWREFVDKYGAALAKEHTPDAPIDKIAHTLKPTQGPWIIQQTSDGTLQVVHESEGLKSVICRLHVEHLCDEHGGSIEANARLIAAAPDLLFACKRAIEEMHGNPREGWDAVQGCMDAIDKAEGRS